jgi:hypothetical protein
MLASSSQGSVQLAWAFRLASSVAQFLPCCFSPFAHVRMSSTLLPKDAPTTAPKAPPIAAPSTAPTAPPPIVPTPGQDERSSEGVKGHPDAPLLRFEHDFERVNGYLNC